MIADVYVYRYIYRERELYTYIQYHKFSVTPSNHIKKHASQALSTAVITQTSPAGHIRVGTAPLTSLG